MNRKKNLIKLLVVGFIGIALFLGGSSLTPSFAEDADEKQGNAGTLLNDLAQSKVSLADGIQQATKGTDVPISAKFELDDEGKLSLSVYTAGKGLYVAAKDNVLKELSGSPESAAWTPKVEIFTDQEHLERAGKQLELVARAKLSLAEIVEKASKEYPGTVVAVTPEVHAEKLVYEVKIAKDGKVAEHHYDVVTGNEVMMDEDEDEDYKDKT